MEILLRLILSCIATLSFLAAMPNGASSDEFQPKGSYEFSPSTEQMTIKGVPEFYSYHPKSEVFAMWFSSRIDFPTATSFQLWGITIKDQIAVREFLQDRAIRCLEVFFFQGISHVDCEAAPDRGKDWVFRGTGEPWLNLFTWLPEMGYATRECNEVTQENMDPIHVGEMGYGCRGQQANRSPIIHN